MDVKVDIDQKAIERRLQSNFKASQMALDEQVMKDMQPYMPFREGDMIKRMIAATDIGSGEIICDAIQARKLYYSSGYNFTKDRNPLATDHWFEHAKAAKKKQWIEMTRKGGDFE